MADCRQFGNGFISISQLEIMRFKSKFGMQMQIVLQGRLLNKILKFCKFKMADDRHFENRLLAISQRVIIGLTRSFVG